MAYVLAGRKDGGSRNGHVPLARANAPMIHFAGGRSAASDATHARTHAYTCNMRHAAHAQLQVVRHTHVSEKAIKDAPAVVRDLIGGAWAPEDVTPINPTQVWMTHVLGLELVWLALARRKEQRGA
eukprot:117583-Chlamydomonas_euryale.AAC.1